MEKDYNDLKQEMLDLMEKMEKILGQKDALILFDDAFNTFYNLDEMIDSIFVDLE